MIYRNNTLNKHEAPPGCPVADPLFQKPYPVVRHLGGLFLGLFLLASCQQPSRTISPAFYYWQTQFALSQEARDLLDTLSCRRLYVKFLDVGREGGTIQPYSLLEVIDTQGIEGRQIVPCVFLTNSVFQDIDDKTLLWLAQKTGQALASAGRQFPETAFPEIQFDCDWTAGTRQAFFTFLRNMRHELPAGTQISATIRLHQYKFPEQTGVPPADRGMLMLYNTGNIDDPEARNSIYRPEDAQTYLQGAPGQYPLPLDVALPAFSWALVYRDGELWKIIPNVSDTAYNGRIPHNTFFGGQYLREGDLVRVETIDSALMLQAARQTAGLPLADSAVAAFYHLDDAAVQRYPARLFKTVCETIQNNR